MIELDKILSQITTFGTTLCPNHSKNIILLKQLLVRMYFEYLKIKDNHYAPSNSIKVMLECSTTRDLVEKNFPDLFWYDSLFDSHKILEEKPFTLGEAINDICDIIIDMTTVKYLFDEGKENDALWLFQRSMKYHSEQESVDLLEILRNATQ